MREEVISSGNNMDPDPAGSSVGASSPAVPAYVGSRDMSSHGHGSKAASLSCVASQQPKTSLSTSAGGSVFGSSRPSCKPWERGDLLRRLATFKPSYWVGKPKVASSLACAERGWINIDADKIACESCGAYLSFVLLPAYSINEVESAGIAFAKQLDAGHSFTCPWRGNSCPKSLVQFPPTPQSALIGDYKDRCGGLLQFQSLPVVAAFAIEQMRISRGLPLEYFLSQSSNFMAGDVDYNADNMPGAEISHGTFSAYSRAQKLISLCGWEPRWLPSVQDCEENSAQSARNGCPAGPSQAQIQPLYDLGLSKNQVPASAKKDVGKSKMLFEESKCESRSPLLDCSICGTSVRVWDFLTVPRPTRLTPNNIDILDTSKKMALTRGVSAASGINGWVPADDVDKEQTGDHDEVATTYKGKMLPNIEVDLNLTMAGGLNYAQLDRTAMSDNIQDTYMGRDLIIGQPSSSEVGDRATSYESRGPSSRKRTMEIGGISNARAHLQADSVEGSISDRDGDEVTDGGQWSAGPSKRVRESDMFDTYCSSYQREIIEAGPSRSLGFQTYVDANRMSSFRQGSDQFFGIPSARDSTRASSVIAMDTVGNSSNDNSMESVENYRGDLDDVQFPSSSIYGNLDMNETSELNCSTQAQQSICFQPAAEGAQGEMGGSSINDGEEPFNTEIATAHQARDGFSFGISGGSVGMCASYEAEIHGTDASVYRANSIVGDVEPRIEDAENQGQTGESAAQTGIVDEISPDEINREDPHGDSQEMFSPILGRADSGSKFDGSVKDETSKKAVVRDGKASHSKHHAYRESNCADVNGRGPLKGESNYEEATEFDPISYHNQFCPWVNGNVAAAGCSNSGSSPDATALCGWQLTLDALDTMRSSGHVPIPVLQSESAASLYKDDDQEPLRRLSGSKSHGQHSCHS